MYCDMLPDWPRRSPNLNSIGNLWAIIKKFVSELAPSTIDELSDAVISLWNEVSQDEINNPVSLMMTKLKATITAQGDQSVD
jgi:hypothetical protein